MIQTSESAFSAQRSELAKPGFPDFPTVTSHQRWYAAASLTIPAGANVKVVQRMDGHKDTAVTLNTYADVLKDDLESVAEVLAKIMRASL